MLQRLLVEEEILTDAALELLRHLREVLLLDVCAQTAMTSQRNVQRHKQNKHQASCESLSGFTSNPGRNPNKLWPNCLGTRGKEPKGNSEAPFTQDAEHLATGVSKLWDTLWSMRVFTQVASNIKGFARKFACKSAYASCVNRA